MNKRWFSSWTFRSSYPSFSEGDVLELYIGNYNTDSDSMEIRIGDTLLEVEGGEPDFVDELIRLRVSQFNEAEHRGKGELLERLETDEF